VGDALARKPIRILVSWHRIARAEGALGLFRARLGSE
jgi:O6-methylguanine-DNA--protein-cysteine methyltransferase